MTEIQNLIDWLRYQEETVASARVGLTPFSKHAEVQPNNGLFSYILDARMTADSLEEILSKAQTYDALMRAAGDLGRNLRGEA